MAPMENASGMKRVENIMKLATKYQTTDEVRQLSDKNKHHSIADTGSAATMPICKEAFPLHTIAESNAQGKSIESLRQTGGGGGASSKNNNDGEVRSVDKTPGGLHVDFTFQHGGAFQSRLPPSDVWLIEEVLRPLGRARANRNQQWRGDRHVRKMGCLPS